MAVDAARPAVRQVLVDRPVVSYDQLREVAGTTSSERCTAAMHRFDARHVCRLDPWPPEVEEMSAQVDEQVYRHMWGASEFTVTGTSRDVDVTADLPSLDLPVLFTCGEHDEARPETVRRHAALVPGARVVELAGASHLPLLESPEPYWSAVGTFLREVEEGPWS